MKIATFNVNSVRARLPILLDWLEKNDPDVLCLQETKVQDHEFPIDPFESAGYNFVFRGQKSYNGVAILSKHQMTQTTFGLDTEPKDQPRLIKTNIKNISIVNTYIPQGFEPDSEKFDYKLKWFSRLKNFFDLNFNPDQSLVWLGDLNVAIEPKDVYDPVALQGHVCFCEQVCEAMKNVIEFGFVDLFREHCDLDGQYSFWDYRMPNSLKRNLGWRLDYIFATKPLADKCSACYIDKTPRAMEKPSDHTPVIAEFSV